MASASSSPEAGPVPASSSRRSISAFSVLKRGPICFFASAGADLSQADLTGADLRGAKLAETNLQGANLSEVHVLRGALTDAIGLSP